MTLSVLVTRSAGPSVLVTPGDFLICWTFASHLLQAGGNTLSKREILFLISSMIIYQYNITIFSYIEFYLL